MNLAQLILAARDTKDWGNILFIVMLAAFYAIGSIVKVIKSKQQGSQDDQASPKPRSIPDAPRLAQQTPHRRPQRPVTRTSHQPQIPPEYRKDMRPQPAVYKPAKASPQIQAGLEQLPEFTSETASKSIMPGPVEALNDKRTGVPAATTRTKYVSKFSSDYADINTLKRAILHYEILGKPLALRKPTEF